MENQLILIMNRLAPARALTRGREYYEDELVRGLAERKGVLTAKVSGQRTYTVRISAKADENFHYFCTCPMGAEGEFCKHCVAVVLSWTEGKAGQRRKKAKEVSLQDVEEYLKTLDSSVLIEMLIEQTYRDETLRRKLFLKTAKSLSNGFDRVFWKKMIEEAFDTCDFVDYYDASCFARTASETVDDIEELLEGPYAGEAIALVEYAIQCAAKALKSMDDSDGEMSNVLDRLQEIHFKACAQTKPDPVRLAQRLFHFELNAVFDEFYGAVDTYASILGQKGLDAYRSLAEQAWAKMPPGAVRLDADHGRSHTVHALFHIMETLAALSGDVEQLVAVKEKDLSSAYNYLQIAEIYKKAGDKDKTLEWAEAGMRAFPQRTDSRLREFLANEYHRRKRHDDAINMIWANFADSLCLDGYRSLQRQANKTKQWPKWREKALCHIREQLTKRDRPGNRWYWNSDYSLLVEIFLVEKNLEAAWSEALAGGCSRSLWMKLAALREQDYPFDAVEVYKGFVDPIVKQTNNQAYDEAFGLIKKMEAVMNRLDKKEDFSAYVADLRIKFKAKRNFMKNA